MFPPHGENVPARWGSVRSHRNHPQTESSDDFTAAMMWFSIMVMKDDNQVTLFAQTNARTDRRIFGIRRGDRRAHMWMVGKTGTGKSTLLQTLIDQDIAN